MRSFISVLTVLCNTLVVLGSATKLAKCYMCCEPKESPGYGVGSSSDVVYLEDERPGRSQEYTSGGRGGDGGGGFGGRGGQSKRSREQILSVGNFQSQENEEDFRPRATTMDRVVGVYDDNQDQSTQRRRIRDSDQYSREEMYGRDQDSRPGSGSRDSEQISRDESPPPGSKRDESFLPGSKRREKKRQPELDCQEISSPGSLVPGQQRPQMIGQSIFGAQNIMQQLPGQQQVIVGQPTFGSQVVNQPTFGSQIVAQPTFGSQIVAQPTFGSQVVQPMATTNQVMVGQSLYSTSTLPAATIVDTGLAVASSANPMVGFDTAVLPQATGVVSVGTSILPTTTII